VLADGTAPERRGGYRMRAMSREKPGKVMPGSGAPEPRLTSVVCE